MSTTTESPDIRLLQAALSKASRPLLAGIEHLSSIDSTNNYLLAAAETGRASGSVCLADHQSAGRGRRGRHWVSPPGGNLYLSLLWRYPGPPPHLAGLSIATGLAVARTLRDLGVTAIQLKWPNDLLWQRRKLGGLLLETRSGSECVVVAGIGLNLRMPPQHTAIDQPWTDLTTILDQCPPRPLLAAELLNRLLPLYQYYPRQREEFTADWAEFDALADQAICIDDQGKTLQGIAQGVDQQGQLRVITAQGLRTFSSGEVTIRSAR